MAQRKTRKSAKSKRRSYNDEYRAEALKLADSVGATAAANQLGIQTSQIYSWRTKARVTQSQTAVEKNCIQLIQAILHLINPCHEVRLFALKQQSECLSGGNTVLATS